MNQKRTKRITVRFSESEYNTLYEGYKRTTCRQISDYIRKGLLGKPLTVRYRNQSMDEHMQLLIRLRNDFNAVAKNFNQVVKKINSVKDKSLTDIWIPFSFNLEKELIERIKAIQDRINEFSDKWLLK